jgi:beta-glucosidase
VSQSGGTPEQFPGVDSTVQHTEGLGIGYRWYQAHRVSPQYPFGYGLSYTHFTLSEPTTRIADHAVVVHVKVVNAGHRPGTAVVQAYLRYPSSADEPPDQLRAFDAVFLGPSQARTVRLILRVSSFEAYLNGGFHTAPGTYSVDIGQSSGTLPIHLRTGAP